MGMLLGCWLVCCLVGREVLVGMLLGRCDWVCCWEVL